jgi:hypothetical protein
MTERLKWTDFTPEQAIEQGLDLSVRTDIDAPLNDAGERCPWPWHPEALTDAPTGQYHCLYCGAMCIAGIRHPDYRNAVEDHEMGMLVQLLGLNLVCATLTTREAITTTVNMLNTLIAFDGENEAVQWMITQQEALGGRSPILVIAVGESALAVAACAEHIKDPR